MGKLESTDRYMKFIQKLIDESYELEKERDMWMRQYMKLHDFLWCKLRIRSYEIK